MKQNTIKSNQQVFTKIDCCKTINTERIIYTKYIYILYTNHTHYSTTYIHVHPFRN